MSLETRIKAVLDSIATKFNQVTGNLGTLASLTTTDKTTIVGAINEVDANADAAQSAATTAQNQVGTLASLTTTAKSSAVAAINEVDANADSKLDTTETTANALILPYGAVGGWGNGYGSGTTWGSTIWSIGRGFKGDIASENKAITGQYGLVWLRPDHPSAISGEGLYVVRNGIIDAGIGNLSAYVSGALSFRNTSAPWIRGYSSDQALTVAGNSAAANSSLIQLFGASNPSGGDEIRIWTGSKVRIRMRGNGRLAIGDDAMAVPDDAAYQLKLSGKAWATQGWETVSDSREKKDLEDITGALEKIRQLSGKKFRYRKGTKLQAGLIAEEWEAVLPEAVSEVEMGEEFQEGETYDRVDTFTEVIDSEQVTDPETGEVETKEITREKKVGVWKRKAIDTMAPYALLLVAIKELQAEVEQLKADGGKKGNN